LDAGPGRWSGGELGFRTNSFLMRAPVGALTIRSCSGGNRAPLRHSPGRGLAISRNANSENQWIHGGQSLTRDGSSCMPIILRSICAISVMLTLASCASSSSSADKNRPHIYRGGQYYGDAWHAGDTDTR
jgi:hypothetical protein